MIFSDSQSCQLCDQRHPSSCFFLFLDRGCGVVSAPSLKPLSAKQNASVAHFSCSLPSSSTGARNTCSKIVKTFSTSFSSSSGQCPIRNTCADPPMRFSFTLCAGVANRPRVTNLANLPTSFLIQMRLLRSVFARTSSVEQSER